ncbi:hypothetical protein Enr17x_16000 [Gimesia fumaroli]|uniref:Uncharacterized protein n=1 Tax=Gimesia fumaroli TaxID=2527976 RepID=A0A518I900_9PLAN|nr:hypothetical protein Enr17x_16000 [Gimesia fumaroli]
MPQTNLKLTTRYEIDCAQGKAALVLDNDAVWGLRWEPYDKRDPYWNDAFHPFMKDQTHQQQLQIFCDQRCVWIDASEAKQIVAIFTEVASKHLQQKGETSAN